MSQTAIITGAGSGIGRAVAIELALQGFDLALAGRRLETLEETASLCSSDALLQTVDVTRADQVEALFSKAKSRWDRLDLLFNNAGTNIPARPLFEQSPEDLSDVIETNLIGAIFCAREAFGWMAHQSPAGGRIINNGSVSAHSPRPLSPAYTAAKHGITGLTKSLILDGWRHGISCCQIDIGNAATARTDRMEAGVLQANGSIAAEPRIDVDVVARQIAQMAVLPSETMIPFLTIMPMGMPLYGRG